jgi:endonuclease YncB( thermonuclease family)
MRTLSVIAFVLPLSSHALAAETFPARVVGVVDGDTLGVSRKEGGTLKVRLYGIDCPEKKQRYGKEARRLAHRLSYGRIVLIESHGKYRYGRTIRKVILPGGKNLNLELVRAGACWWYRRYAPKDETLRQMEAEAREARRGLWANPKPVPPWEWRKGRRAL